MAFEVRVCVPVCVCACVCVSVVDRSVFLIFYLCTPPSPTITLRRQSPVQVFCRSSCTLAYPFSPLLPRADEHTQAHALPSLEAQGGASPSSRLLFLSLFLRCLCVSLFTRVRACFLIILVRLRVLVYILVLSCSCFARFTLLFYAVSVVVVALLGLNESVVLDHRLRRISPYVPLPSSSFRITACQPRLQFLPTKWRICTSCSAPGHFGTIARLRTTLKTGRCRWFPS